jgi:hypothetical protein
MKLSKFSSNHLFSILVFKAVIESTIRCSSSIYFILFWIRVEFEFMTELDNLFKLGSFIFRINSSFSKSCLISLFIPYIK